MLRVNHYLYQYNFAIIYNTNDNPFQYGPETIGRQLPSPTNIYKCTDSAHQIWLYDNDLLDSTVKDMFTQFLFRKKLNHNFQIDAKFLPSTTGMISGQNRTARSSQDKPGFLTFGPYLNLDEGRYEISITYTAIIPNDSLASYVDIGQFNSNQDIVLYKKNLQNYSNHTDRVIVDIPKGGMSGFEVRTWFSGEGSLTIHHLKVVRLKH